MSSLMSALTLGSVELSNRVVMAPLTRCRAAVDGVPNQLMVDYYTQRASAGLIVSEGAWISQQGKGYAYTPGIANSAHVAGWKVVTDAVHAAGGRIFCQLWHVGCVSHPKFQEGGALPVSSSEIQLEGESRTEEGKFPYVKSRALRYDEVARIVQEYEAAATRAIEAGFDGVEIHGANDYLIDQFTKSTLNHRDDDYGGSIENRIRFGVEVCQAVAGAIGGGRTGLRLSPTGSLFVPADDDPLTVYSQFVDSLVPLHLAYIHLVERFPGRTEEDPRQEEISQCLARSFNGSIIFNGGYTPSQAATVIDEGGADAISFGRLFISNPDLAERIENGLDLQDPDAATFYTQGAEGYTDYSFANTN